MNVGLIQSNMSRLLRAEMLERLLPAMPYLAVMLSLLVTLALFLALKSDVQKFTIRVRKHALRERQRVDQLSDDLQELAAKPQPVAEAVYVPVSAPSGYQLTGFNINRRVQALRLLRRGEDTAHIAAALGVARQEIELLIRVQKLVAQAKRPTPKESDSDQAPATLSQNVESQSEVPSKLENIAPTTMELSFEAESKFQPMTPANIGTIRRRKVAALA